MNLISIIIPVFNREKFIDKTLDSIINQTYGNWECIIIDDGSQDNTIKILNKYSIIDKRIRFECRPKNLLKGANACRNYGLELSQGEYIIWFDSDDLMKNKKLEEQIKLIKATNDNYVISQSEVVDKINGSKRLWNSNLISCNPLNDYLQYKISWQTGAVLLKKEFLIENNLRFDEMLKQSQEYYFYAKVLSTDSSYSVDNNILNTIISHDDSISYSKKKFYEKSSSSILVKRKLLRDKSIVLNNSTKHFLVRDILRILSKSLDYRDSKSVRLSGINFILNLVYISNYSITKKIKNILFTLFLIFSYSVTGKGYYFYKKIKF